MVTVINPEKTNELSLIAEKIDTGLQAFDKRKADLIELKEQATGLKITSIEDKVSINQVSVIRKKLKSARVEVEREGKQMRDPLTKLSKFISEKEKELVGIIEPTEKELLGQEIWLENEIDKIKQAAIDARIEQLSFTGKAFDRVYIGSLDNETFSIILNSYKDLFEKEKAEKAEAERLRLLEAERIKAEREELERLRTEQLKAQAIIRAENERIRKEQHEREVAIQAEKQKLEEDKLAAELDRKRIELEKQRAAELEQARKDAAEKARLQAIEDARIQAETKERELQEAKAKAEREAAMMPDKEKLQAFAMWLPSIVDFEVSDEKAKAIVIEIKDTLATMQGFILSKLNEL